MKRKSLYKITEGEIELFRVAALENNPNRLTNFYLRNASSGTWWRRVEQKQVDALRMQENKQRATEWKDGYESLLAIWKWLKKPSYFMPDPNDAEDWHSISEKEYLEYSESLTRTYRVVFELSNPLWPTFHHRHGFLFIDWQKEMHMTNRNQAIVPGGFGCIAGETLIFDAEMNQHISAQSYFDSGVAPTVWAWDSELRLFVKAKASKLYAKGFTGIYRVRTRTGHRISVTKEHRFYTPDGWRMLDDMGIGDDIYIATKNSLIETKIDDIRFIRADVFYDLHVPIHENYLAEGFINHNSAKTWGAIASMALSAITLPNYIGMILAPEGKQSSSVFDQLMRLISGTLYQERFVINKVSKPYPQIIIGHSSICDSMDFEKASQITAYPLDNPDSFLTLSADEAVVDQAEQIIDIDQVTRTITSRFRGTDAGRERKGKIIYLANSGQNPTLYDLYDEGQDPKQENIWSYQPATYENIYLTVKDLSRYEQNFGQDAASQEMYIKGGRPLGDGKHFPSASLAKCRNTGLDLRMEEGLNQGLPGYVRKEAQRVAVHNWELPFDKDDKYIVVADPGWDNPPERNSAVIAVFKITDFPRVPATMVAFDWVYGNNSPNPWIAKYTQYVMRYQAIGFNGFDSTGFQSGYERMTDLGELLPTPVSLAANKKFTYLNLAKKMFADGKFSIPAGIPHLWHQLSNYVIPDEKTRQDIVMMFMVAVAILEPYYYLDFSESDELPEYNPSDRYWRGDVAERSAGRALDIQQSDYDGQGRPPWLNDFL